MSDPSLEQPATPRPDDGTCPHCRGELELGYGLAGSRGIGPYTFCPACERVIDKWPEEP